MGTSKFNAGGNHVMDQYPIQGGVEIFLCYRNRDKLQPGEPLGLYADLTNRPLTDSQPTVDQNNAQVSTECWQRIDRNVYQVLIEMLIKC